MTSFSIGRDDDNDVVLDDPSVSPKHATIGVLAAGMYRLTDLGSKGGTFVRERRQWVRFKEYDVAAHDRVKLGEYAVRVAELLPQGAAPRQNKPEADAVQELREAAREMFHNAEQREAQSSEMGEAWRVPAKAVAGFAAVTISIIIVVSMFTGGSAHERFKGWCSRGSLGSSATCECQADVLAAKLSDGEIDRMMDIIESSQSSSNPRLAKKRLGRKILTGTLVNERVSKAVLQSAKACLGE